MPAPHVCFSRWHRRQPTPQACRDFEMTQSRSSRFSAKLLRPANMGNGDSWAFLVLPKAASDTLPRRGRTSIEGVINEVPFQATLDPDGQLSHWLKVTDRLLKTAGAAIGDVVTVEFSPVDAEPEPLVPDDLQEALSAAPSALAAWAETTTIARVDWIHWLDAAKQARTRKGRVASACERLASGKKRVCCFDQSGFYSKSLSAPQAAS